MSKMLPIVLALACAPLLQGCLAAAAVSVAGDVAEGAVRTTGAVVGAGADAVTTSKEEKEKKKRDRDDD